MRFLEFSQKCLKLLFFQKEIISSLMREGMAFDMSLPMSLVLCFVFSVDFSVGIKLDIFHR